MLGDELGERLKELDFSGPESSVQLSRRKAIGNLRHAAPGELEAFVSAPEHSRKQERALAALMAAAPKEFIQSFLAPNTTPELERALGRMIRAAPRQFIQYYCAPSETDAKKVAAAQLYSAAPEEVREYDVLRATAGFTSSPPKDGARDATSRTAGHHIVTFLKGLVFAVKTVLSVAASIVGGILSVLASDGSTSRGRSTTSQDRATRKPSRRKRKRFVGHQNCPACGRRGGVGIFVRQCGRCQRVACSWCARGKVCKACQLSRMQDVFE